MILIICVNFTSKIDHIISYSRLTWTGFTSPFGPHEVQNFVAVFNNFVDLNLTRVQFTLLNFNIVCVLQTLYFIQIDVIQLHC
jgi:hypothetical protein